METVTAAVFQVFLKWLIGGLRPHFLAGTARLARGKSFKSNIIPSMSTKCAEPEPSRNGLPIYNVYPRSLYW